MRISEHMGLKRSQHELDFVDLDISTDTPLYLEPYFLKHAHDAWSKDASATIKNYWDRVNTCIRAGDTDGAKELMAFLGESNETCLGHSQGRPAGRGIGTGGVEDVVEAIVESRAAKKGLIQDLEDIRVLVPGIGPDKISDMVTAIIRAHLIQYTQEQCDLWNVALASGKLSGFYWDAEPGQWARARTDLLYLDDRPILLVPKAAISTARAFTQDRYWRHFALPFLQADHLRRNTSLVTVNRLKTGRERRYVRKTDLEATEAPNNLDFLISFTERHPSVFEDFKETLPMRHMDPLESEELARRRAGLSGAEPLPKDDAAVVVAEHLTEQLSSIRTGTKEADSFHNLVHAILEFVFYPRLTRPQKEQPIRGGRKRIDLKFDNAANAGFFHRLHDVQKLASEYIFFECKNYSTDPKNPELDQLAGRFHVNYSQVGFLVCRAVDDMDTLILRCNDAYQAKRELMIPLVDADLLRLLSERGRGDRDAGEGLLRDRADAIILA